MGIMVRIFNNLVRFGAALLLVTWFLGLYVGDPNDPKLLNDPTLLDHAKTMTRVHMMFGVGLALAVVLINSIVITYFIGTGRWCKEVVETYSLDRRFVEQATILKRTTFPWALGAILAVTGVIALGAAANPFIGGTNTAAWVIPHLIGAIAGFAFIGQACVIEARRIRVNQEVITEIMSEVKRIRLDRGLEV
jgi:hypothetical protein